MQIKNNLTRYGIKDFWITGEELRAYAEYDGIVELLDLSLIQDKYYSISEYEEKCVKYECTHNYYSRGQLERLYGGRLSESGLLRARFISKGARYSEDSVLLAHIETKVKHAISREKAQELTGYSTEILNMLVKDGLLRYNNGFDQEEIDLILLSRKGKGTI